MVFSVRPLTFGTLSYVINRDSPSHILIIHQPDQFCWRCKNRVSRLIFSCLDWTSLTIYRTGKEKCLAIFKSDDRISPPRSPNQFEYIEQTPEGELRANRLIKPTKPGSSLILVWWAISSLEKGRFSQQPSSNELRGGQRPRLFAWPLSTRAIE